MKISKIEYKNFRNFKGEGEIKCSTDGKVTIIYGKNGDGKTTLHQLFQWVFYGEVHFNKTTTDTLYNLSFESEQPYNSNFEVMGRIDFEHMGEQYSLTRTITYRKELDSSAKVNEELELNHKDAGDNWKRIDRPQETIEKLLPSGLSDYFFFDGENMIADLRVKGKDSAKSLRKALYSIFDLDVLESALNHIGDTNLKTTVLGKLYLSKSNITSGSDINATKNDIENAQNKIEEIEAVRKEEAEEEIAKKELISQISEQIGSTKSKEEYAKERGELVRQRDAFLTNVKSDMGQFGDMVIADFPQLLISKAVEDAKKRIHLKVEDSKLPQGLDKRLITYLTLLSTSKCICGRDLTDEHKAHIKSFLDMMPPNSYDNMYSNFNAQAKQWGKGYSREKIEDYIKRVIDNQEQANACDVRIRELDEDKNNSKNIEDLVVDRKNAETRVEEIEASLQKSKVDLEKFEMFLKKKMKEYDKLTEQTKANRVAMHKIEIMSAVKDYFRECLDDESEKYSKILQDHIQSLLNEMLTSKRTVSVSPEFAVKVVDSYKDESKSEGQFAVVSFAYIGGILKLVADVDSLSGKEYPLVLDGPFSKLDADQRQNVIVCIPKFAPQVILFSKDSLQDYFDPSVIGRVYTIQSNDEKNIASVKEGFLWTSDQM